MLSKAFQSISLHYARLRRVGLTAVCALVWAGIPGTQTMAEPIGLMERFALSDDRQAILAELIPGTDDYFFYHCLHHQNTGQLDLSEAELKQWIASRRGQKTALIEAMLDRQRLLTYGQSPQQSIDYLVDRLGIRLQHAPPPKQGERRFPSSLDDGFINPVELVKQSLRDNIGLSPIGMKIAAELYSGGVNSVSGVSLSNFVDRINGPYLPNLDQLVIAELRSRNARDVKFGDRAAHKYLTLRELERVGQAVPAVADDNTFVYHKLHLLRPAAGVRLSQQPEQRREYLSRVEAYLRTLPPAYNSLKASATYRLLEANLTAGIWDKALFLRYLQLPRQSPIVNPVLLRSGLRANLNQDFTQVAILPPIGDEQTLVVTYLEHFLRDARDTSVYARYLQPDFLRRVFARTKLMSGVANPQPYYDMLSAGEQRELRDKTQLSFAPNNTIRYTSDQPTELIVDVKNIDQLIIRIYEINALAFHRTGDGQLDTDVELDGLIATHEKRIDYDRPSVVRHRETIAIPEASGRGVWIIDLVGKGLRSRCLIRRGDLETVRASTASGTRITILDENRQPVPAGKILIGNQEFPADENGQVLLPMVSKTDRKKAIVADGKIAESIQLSPMVEDYSLQAGFFVDPTLLQSGATASVLVRPQLRLRQTVVDPAILDQVTVRIVATDLDGIQTTKQIEGVELSQRKDLEVEFRVPNRLAKLEFTLAGQVTGLSDRRERELSTTRSIDLAGIRRTSRTVDAFLTRDGDGYVIETRGRSGELVSGVTVQTEFELDLGEVRPKQSLQSDAQGLVRLGELSDVSTVRYGIAGESMHAFSLDLNRQIWPSAITLSSDDEMKLPLVDGSDAGDFRLLEQRDGKDYADLSQRLSLDNGFLTASGLPAGDLVLLDRRTMDKTPIAVIDGQAVDSILVGTIRHRETHPRVPLSIETIKTNADGSVLVQLAGQSDLARVHVIASRYFGERSPLQDLYLGLPSLRGRSLSLSRCGYVSDLQLGDEYEYVLRRQYAAKYPGVMLPQPSVLLNPWETQTTSNTSQRARAGAVPPPAAAATPGEADELADSMRRRSQAQAQAPDYDFLDDSGVVAANLIPDADGRLTIPAEVVQNMPIIQIVVADPVTMLKQTVTTALTVAERRDLRLPKPLPLDQSLTFERAVSIISADNPLDLATLGSAQIQVYGDVASLLTIYRTLCGDERLKEFEVLGRWHTLSTEQKLQNYSELASHELHLFMAMHDREFFDSTIKPYLANKKEKQFIDDWLLGKDLTPYTTLWQYRKLSAAERALLAVRVPAMRDAVRRDLAETVALMELDADAGRRQIESALRISGMTRGQRQNESIAVMSDAFGFDGMNGLPSDKSDRSVAGGMGGGGRFSRQSASRGLQRALAESAPARGGRAMLGERMMGYGGGTQFYQDLDSTKQWAESNFDQVRVVGGPSPSELIPVNAFWSDLAANWPDASSAPPVSRNLLQCTGNRHSALIALALSGLPLQSGEIGLPTRPETIYRPQHPVALVTKRLRMLKSTDEASSVLIGQLFRESDDDNSKSKAATSLEQFLTGKAYRGQIVLSNPTAETKTVELFWQIPAGSVPLAGSQVTDSKTVELEPFAVSSVEYQFYFPAEGQFTHYPATVADGDTLLARASEKTFAVADEWTDDAVTWESIAAGGSAEEIEQFLATANLRDLNWSSVLHRLRDQSVYQTVTNVLRQSRLPELAVWAYGFHHKDEDAMQRYLSLRDDLVARVGPVLQSPLLIVDSIDRHSFEHLEYAPLVRARIHRLGDTDEILNPTFLAQYRQFVRRLGFQSRIGDYELMPLTYYLLIQNRIEEAITRFESIDRDKVSSGLQYDYLNGYLDLHRGEYEAALAIARRHQSHPVPRWKTRFTEMVRQVQQRFELMDAGQLVSTSGEKSKSIDDNGVSPKAADLAMADRERANSQASAAAAEVMIRIEDDSVRVDHRNTDQVELNFYGVDLELLFSNAPFAQNDLKRIAMVRPTQSETLSMTSKTGTTRFQVPGDLRSQTLLVEANVGSSRSTALYFGGELTTYVSEAFGQLQATDSKTHQPVPRAYVKVYGRYSDGSVRFYKDGYTDGRGRFDYTSLSAADAQGAERFAILVLSEKQGATIHDVKAP